MKKAGLYIHIPFCTQKCSYCDFFSVNNTGFSVFLSGKNGSPFIRRVLEDVQFQAERYGIDEWDTVYVGGGTPSILSPYDIFFLFSAIIKKQKVPPCECTVEVNPEDVCKEWLDAAVQAGVTRISAGVQSFSDEVLHAEKRRGGCKKTAEALSLIKVKKLLLSCDLIAGLKKQTDRVLREDLEKTLEFAPEHLSFYSLCTDMPLSEEDADYIDSLWLSGKTFLEKNGYVLYEVSNFSYKNEYKSVHNSKYWKLEDYAAAGPGAAGSMFFDRRGGKGAGAVRFSVCKDINLWLCAKEPETVYGYEAVCEKELVEETFMMQLRLVEGLDRRAFLRRFGADIMQFAPVTISSWVDAGRAELSDVFFTMTERGRLFLNDFLHAAFTEIECNYR